MSKLSKEELLALIKENNFEIKGSTLKEITTAQKKTSYIINTNSDYLFYNIVYSSDLNGTIKKTSTWNIKNAFHDNTTCYLSNLQNNTTKYGYADFCSSPYDNVVKEQGAQSSPNISKSLDKSSNAAFGSHFYRAFRPNINFVC